MHTVSIKREAMQELYQVERKVRPDISAFLSSLGKEPMPKGVGQQAGICFTTVLGYTILWRIEGNWVIVLKISPVDEQESL